MAGIIQFGANVQAMSSATHGPALALSCTGAAAQWRETGYQTMTAIGLLEAMREASGGWWRSLTPHELLALYTAQDDTYYRAHYTHATSSKELNGFPESQAAYVLGHVAGFSPEYSASSWDRVEPLFKRAWERVATTPWSEVAGYTRTAFRRGLRRNQEAWMGWGTESDADTALRAEGR